MFSGLKSIIFGYSEADNEVSSSEQAASGADKASPIVGVSKLEKTLNAATTKFTEQLLPQQASIEQLQSSSRQLLPSLNEQGEQAVCKDNTENGQDDDECFNVESWELLDLIESPNDGSPSRKDDSAPMLDTGLSKSTSGILKSSVKSSDQEDITSHQLRQKPKVSFEIPDLVSSENKIESSKPKGVSKSKKKSTDGTSGELIASPDKLKATLSGPNDTTHQSTMQGSVKRRATSGSVLNYAAAVQAKPKDNFISTSSSIDETVEFKAPIEPKTNGPVKRNRLISTCSSSSEDVEIVSRPPIAFSEVIVTPEETFIESGDDISSNFSDVEFDYEASSFMTNFVRAKRRNMRRKRTISISASMGKTMEESCLLDDLNKYRGSDEVKDESKSFPKSMKPKKKRMVCTSSSFLKNKPEKSGSFPSKGKELPSVVCNSSNDSSDVAEMDESWYVTPPPCFTGSNRSTNTVDKIGQPLTKVADRENALIEHPSIYIASTSKDASSKKKSKGKGRLIVETPGMVDQKTGSNKESDIAWNSDDENLVEFDSKIDFSCVSNSPKDIDEFRPINRKGKATKRGPKNGQGTANPTSSQARRPIALSSVGKGVAGKAKAWENKFMVNEWNIDDPEDVDDDFDNIFKESAGATKKSSNKKKRPPKPSSASEAEKKMMSHGQAKTSPFQTESAESIEPEFSAISESSLIHDSEIESLSTVAPSDSPVMIDMENQFEEGTGLDLETSKGHRSRGSSQKRPPTQVRPIEPERRPGWQLQRQRSKRRPLTTVNQNRSQASSNQRSRKISKSSERDGPQSASRRSDDIFIQDRSSASSLSSGSSLIDRIGSSIVANLTTLTNGLVSSSAIPGTGQINGRQQLDANRFGRAATSVALGGKSGVNELNNLMTRKNLSESSIKRSNVCAHQASSQHRPDRRLKMFATRNGYSVNRKVHTSVH